MAVASMRRCSQTTHATSPRSRSTAPPYCLLRGVGSLGRNLMLLATRREKLRKTIDFVVFTLLVLQMLVSVGGDHRQRLQRLACVVSSIVMSSTKRLTMHETNDMHACCVEYIVVYTEAHLVAEHAVQAEAPQEREPVHARLLIPLCGRKTTETVARVRNRTLTKSNENETQREKQRHTHTGTRRVRAQRCVHDVARQRERRQARAVEQLHNETTTKRMNNSANANRTNTRWEDTRISVPER